jgi:hypothetical protein
LEFEYILHFRTLTSGNQALDEKGNICICIYDLFTIV